MPGIVCSEDTWIVCSVGGCWGCLCVSMELTGVDNCSNDCGGIVEAAAQCQGLSADGAELLGWMCHSFCVCSSPESEVLIGPSYTGSKFRAVFCCELAARPLRMKHQGMCHLSSRPTVTTLSTPLRIKPRTAFVFRNPVKDISLP